MRSFRLPGAAIAAVTVLVGTSLLGPRPSATVGAAPVPERTAAETAAAILWPSIQVHGRTGGGGGGTIVYSRRGETYALTAFHVVAKAVQRDADGRETRQPVAVTLYRADGAPDTRLDADLVVWHERKDVALLRLRTDRMLPAAKTASRAARASTGVFTPVYAVGCPLGHDPLPTAGEISTLRKVVQGERFWMMSAPTIYGNSGGGVFHRDTLDLIGVSTMICTYDNPSATPVPHLGIVLPIESVAAWLDTTGRLHIIDPEAPPAGASARRDW